MASDDAKPATPAPADPPADDAKDPEPEPEEPEAEPEPEPEEEEQPQTERKRGRRKKGEAAAAAADKKASAGKAPPATPTVDRPSRERKTVERYSELAPRVTPAKKSPAILQGSGTKLRDIPNVAFKLSKRKVDENLQSLHTLMYGRKSNVHFLKRNISQFSGFVWTDNQEKQRGRIKEKLEKFNKEKLLDFCEILDIYVPRATTKKEEVSAKLLEFLESPCVTRDVVLTEEKKRKKRGKRSKASGQATPEGASEGKKRKRSRKQTAETEKENDDEDDTGPAGSEDASMGEEDEDSEAKDHAGSDEEPDEPPAKKLADGKQGKKEAAHKQKEEDASGKKGSAKHGKGVSRAKADIEDEQDAEESKKAGKKASKGTSKVNDVSVEKTGKRVSKPRKVDGKESQNNNSSGLNTKARKKDGPKASNKNRGKGKDSTNAGSAPTTKELHAVVSDILKEVDFNTATLADILRQLGTHFKMDLMDRKSEVKRIIEEVINSMSDDEGEEENDEDVAEGNGKEENRKEDTDGGDEK